MKSEALAALLHEFGSLIEAVGGTEGLEDLGELQNFLLAFQGVTVERLATAIDSARPSSVGGRGTPSRIVPTLKALKALLDRSGAKASGDIAILINQLERQPFTTVREFVAVVNRWLAPPTPEQIIDCYLTALREARSDFNSLLKVTSSMNKINLPARKRCGK